MFEQATHTRYLGFNEENLRCVPTTQDGVYEDLRLWSAIQEAYGTKTLRNYIMDFDPSYSKTFDDQKEDALFYDHRSELTLGPDRVTGINPTRARAGFLERSNNLIVIFYDRLRRMKTNRKFS